MKKNTVDLIIKSVNYITAPIVGIASIWGVDISVYVAAGCGAVASVLSFIKLFCRD